MPTDAQDFAALDKADRDSLADLFAKRKAARKCWLCQCQHTVDVFGVPKCDYHKVHGVDSPQCPKCGSRAAWE